MAEAKHHLVDFASRHARTALRSLNAASAIWRAEGLRYDIDEFLELRKEAEAKNVRFGSWHQGYEAFAYYSVGLVTCLEWHACSRLVDLLLFKPSCIQKSDITPIADLALSQMVAEGVNLPHLLGAAKKVNSFDDYIGVFKRLFRELDITDDLDKLIHKKANHTPSFHKEISEIYAYRHELVHEISYATIGHWNIRNVWTLEDSRGHAERIIDCMKMIELIITEKAPKSFPNRMTKEGVEEDELEKYKGAVAQTEKEIREALAADEGALEAWEKSLAQSKEAIKADMEFIENTIGFAPVRYFDVRPVMKVELLKSRLEFLTIIKSEIR